MSEPFACTEIRNDIDGNSSQIKSTLSTTELLYQAGKLTLLQDGSSEITCRNK